MKDLKKVNAIAKYILTGVVTVGFFALLFVMVKTIVPVENRDMMNIIVGALIGSYLTVINYHFSSSAGSSEKTDQLNKQNNTNLTQP